MKYNCATLFNPQYTHLKKNKDILRVTVYGFPARYKRLETEKETEVETVEETHTDGDRQVSTQKKDNASAYACTTETLKKALINNVIIISGCPIGLFYSFIGQLT